MRAARPRRASAMTRVVEVLKPAVTCSCSNRMPPIYLRIYCCENRTYEIVISCSDTYAQRTGRGERGGTPARSGARVICHQPKSTCDAVARRGGSAPPDGQFRFCLALSARDGASP